MGNTVVINGEQHVVNQCGTCAVWHTIPKIMYDSAAREGGYWHCPNGHTRGWEHGSDKREQDALRRERDRLKQDAARMADEIAAEQIRTETERRRASAAEKKLLQVKRRANAGVCQCCNRTFLNVQRHMKSKHPNVVPLEFKAS